MRITLLGVLVMLAGVALLIYIGHELQSRNEQQQPDIKTDPEPPLKP
jgi:hypothetical protein